MKNWPTLAQVNKNIRIYYEQAVLAKKHWFAKTEECHLSIQQEDLKTFLLEASENSTIESIFYWRTIAPDYHLAIHGYNSPVGFEQYILQVDFDYEETAAVLLALALLDHVKDLDNNVWFDNTIEENPWDKDPEYTLTLADAIPLDTTEEKLQALIEQGIADLQAQITPQDLKLFYQQLLSKQCPLALLKSEKPLSALALAALMLPLDTKVVNNLSIAGWFDQTAIEDIDTFSQNWQAIVCPYDIALPDYSIEPEIIEQAKELVHELLDILIVEEDSEDGTSKKQEKPIDKEGPSIALWGSSSTGKTVLLSQLYLSTDYQPMKDWEILPTRRSHEFIEEMRNTLLENQFPMATTTGQGEDILYEFQKRGSNLRVFLSMQDRAGIEHATRKTEAQEQLFFANGLIFLIDYTAEYSETAAVFPGALEALYINYKNNVDIQAEKDSRPIAICFSKADLLIDTHEKLMLAINNPEEFIKKYIDNALLNIVINAVERFYNNYRLFPISSIGINMQYEAIIPAVIYDEKFKPRVLRNTQPLNLNAAFSWVLDEVTV